MSDIAISVKNISKNFKLPHHNQPSSLKGFFINPFSKTRSKESETQYALKDISFDVKKGEFFGIVGRNGSGKSTLLKIIASIYKPNKGSVQIDGRLVPFIELGVGFNPELSGRENVYLSGALMGFSSNDVKKKYAKIVEFAELERFMDQKLKNYSSGMQVRLAFSVATMLADSEILLIDEVLAVGDADFQRKCFQYFRSLKRNKKTVIFVSHDMEAVREYCDRCLLIDNSQTVFEGAPDKAAEKYTQLFNPSDSAEANDSHSTAPERWGDGKAKFTDVSVSVEQADIFIESTVRFNNRMDSPIVGVLIKNTSGATICGTNNKVTRQKLGVVEKGEEYSVSWIIPNIFSDDDYTVEVAVTYSDGITQADWWHDAAKFSVHNTETTPHIISPKIEMSIKQ